METHFCYGKAKPLPSSTVLGAHPSPKFLKTVRAHTGEIFVADEQPVLHYLVCIFPRTFEEERSNGPLWILSEA